jgi:hypothetical protein
MLRSADYRKQLLIKKCKYLLQFGVNTFYKQKKFFQILHLLLLWIHIYFRQKVKHIKNTLH